MVSVLAIYSVNLRSNPAEVYNFSVKLYLKRTKINKEAGVGPFLNNFVLNNQEALSKLNKGISK